MASLGGLYVAPRNWFLLAVLVGLFGFWSFGKGGSIVEMRNVQPLLDSFDADQAQRILLERPDAAAVETDGVERSTLVLQSAPGGDGKAPWTIEELFGAKAFRDRVERLLSRIGSMTTLDLVSQDPARHAEYGLTEDRALRIRVFATESLGESSLVDLLLAPAPDRAAWVRKSGEDEVWRIARFYPPSAAPLAWFDDSSLMPYNERALRSIGASGTALSSEVAIQFVPGAERFVDLANVAWDARLVLDLQSRLQTLFPVKVVGAKAAGDALDEQPDSTPWLRVTFVPLTSGKRFHIEFAEPQEGVLESEAVLVEGTTRVTVSSSTVQKIASRLQELLAAQAAAEKPPK